MKKGKYYEWDENDFVLPEKYKLGKNASLVEALNVFWSAGGLDFFNVTDPRYYASNWLDFLGMLYRRIADGEFVVSNTGDFKRSMLWDTKLYLTRKL